MVGGSQPTCMNTTVHINGESMGSYSEDDITEMFDGSTFAGIKAKGVGKNKTKIIRWEDVDYESIPQLQGKELENFFDKPHIMRFIIKDRFPEIIEDIKKGIYKKPIPFE